MKMKSDCENALVTGEKAESWPKHSASLNRRGTHPTNEAPPGRAHRTHQESDHRHAAMSKLHHHG